MILAIGMYSEGFGANLEDVGSEEEVIITHTRPGNAPSEAKVVQTFTRLRRI